ncbi:MAG: tetratricopeptide repeat protein [Dehalococcoidia bacterium]
MASPARAEIGTPSAASGRTLGYVTKVRVPTPRNALVPRPRLIDLQRRHLARRITVVSAPAGYGKTSLLADFARSLDRPLCWYSLDQGDGDPATFLQYLVLSLQQQFPTFGRELPEWAGGGGQAARDGARLVGALVNEICRSIPEPFVIVLDDFHHLDESPAVLKLLGALLLRLPDHCHLIVASRTWPKLSVLPLLTARQEVGKIDTSLLAFTASELEQFLAGVLPSPPDGEAVGRLLESTEGWIAAALLAASGEAGASPSMAAATAGILGQFLEAEVWAGQPPAVQEFIQRTSILRRLEPYLCDELSDSTDARHILSLLERCNLCWAQVEGEDVVYRYHPLVRRFLAEKLRTEAPAEYADLNLMAASMYEQAGLWEETMYHYGQGGAWSQVAHVLDTVADDMAQHGRWHELAQWLDAIPSSQMETQPHTLLWRAKILHHMNQLDQALQAVDRATALLEVGHDWPALADALVVQATCLRLKGDYARAIEACTNACSLLVEKGGSVGALAGARKELGITYGMSGQLELAVCELKRALETYEAKGDSPNIAHVSDKLGSALMLMGRLAEATGYLEKGCHRWRRLDNQLRLVQTLNNLGMLYYFQGEYDRAEDALREGLQKAEEQGYTRHKAYLMASIADVQRQRGQYKAALDLYRRCLDLAHEMEDMYLVIYTTDGLANVLRLTGELNKAQTLIDHAIAEAEDRGGVFEMGLCQTSLGLIQMDKGEVKEAAACLERAVELLAKGDAKRELAVASFHLAEAYYRQHRKSDAFDCLQQVSALAQELGHMDFLVPAAAAAPLLVQYGAARKVGEGFYHRLLQLLKAPAPAAEEPTTAPAAKSLPTVEAYGLAEARVVVDGREVTDLEWRSERSKEMFFYFLSHARTLRKEEVVTALWPDLPEEKCNSAFHSNLYRLRQAVYAECVVKQGGRYLLNPQGRFWYDVAEFQGLVRSGEAAGNDDASGAEAMERALALYRGGFASDFYSDWAEALRWQLEEQHLRIISDLAARYLEKGDYQRAGDLYRRILQQDEYNETAWYRLMRTYLEAGQVEAAKYCYQRYSDLLRELGEAPTIEFATLCKRAPGA